MFCQLKYANEKLYSYNKLTNKIKEKANQQITVLSTA